MVHDCWLRGVWKGSAAHLGRCGPYGMSDGTEVGAIFRMSLPVAAILVVMIPAWPLGSFGAPSRPDNCRFFRSLSGDCEQAHACHRRVRDEA